MHKKAKIFAALFIPIIVFWYIVYYGFSFSFPPCIYTEKEISLPVELQGVVLLADGPETAYIEGVDGEGLSCSKTLGRIEKSIVNWESTAMVQHFGAKDQGSIQGMRFTPKRMVASTKHGISTIDSGSGPIHWLVVEDENGVLYRLATVYLGYDVKESFLSVWNNGQRKGALIYSGSDIVSVDSGQGK